MPEKKVACKSLILNEAHDPEGQRFKSSPRNQLIDNNKLLPNSSSLVYKSLDFLSISQAEWLAHQ